MADQFEFQEMLYSALLAEVGIIIETDDIELCKQRLYAARRQAADPALKVLSFIVSPTNHKQLWILKRTPHETEGTIPDPEGDSKPAGG